MSAIPARAMREVIEFTLARESLEAEAFQKGRAWIELDMENLRRNVSILRGILPGGCELMPSVKANAHGHGAVEICKELNALGVNAFCVASVTEGVELRKNHIRGEILILGYTHPELFPLLGRNGLTQTVIDGEYAAKLNAYANESGGQKLSCHIKIDTGMNRLGVPASNTDDVLRIFECENLDVTGVYSHLCAQNSGDEIHRAFTEAQLEEFNHVLKAIGAHGRHMPRIHLQSSFGVFSRPDLRCDFARVGMALYGVYRNCACNAPDAGNARDSGIVDRTISSAGLRPVLSLKARVSAVKDVHAGEAVGYELAFIAAHGMKLAVLSIGYADGLPRALSCGAGHVLIGGKTAPVVGNICMDQTMVDVSGIEGVRQGDVAVIIGRDGGAEISAYDIAAQAGTVPNEILGRLGGRLERCARR